MNLRYSETHLQRKFNNQPRNRILLLWFFISTAGIMIIKSILRPKYLELSEPLSFLQGTLPNFFAGAMFTVLAYIYSDLISILSSNHWKRYLFAFLFSFFGLTLWEFIQFYMGFPIDYYDILMTAIGNACTIFIILIFRIE